MVDEIDRLVEEGELERVEKQRRDWSKIVEVVSEEIIPRFKAEGVTPTVRAIFYALVSRRLIENTQNDYKQLCDRLVDARKKGKIRWEDIVDTVRYSEGELLDKDIPKIEEIDSRCKKIYEKLDVNEIIDNMFLEIKNGLYMLWSSENTFWTEQDVVPEVWIEKDAIASVVTKIVEDLAVKVRVMRGYSSWSFVYNIKNELLDILERHEKIIVLYIGDYDPSGVDIERHLKEQLKFFKLSNRVEVKRIMVTKDQIRKYKLPPQPAKKSDPRYKAFPDKDAVEVDAFLAFAPKEFKEIIRNEILKYHDKKKYEEVRKRVDEFIKQAVLILKDYKQKVRDKLKQQLVG